MLEAKAVCEIRQRFDRDKTLEELQVEYDSWVSGKVDSHDRVVIATKELIIESFRKKLL